LLDAGTTHLRTILDPVHGLIGITRTENDATDHPLFQRLRYVRNVSFLHLVFPSANHTRFEHSLGTMQVAQLMFSRMMENCVTARQKNQHCAPR